jgi:hypothetical protein
MCGRSNTSRAPGPVKEAGHAFTGSNAESVLPPQRPCSPCTPEVSSDHPPDHTKRPPTVRQSPLMAQYWRYTGLHDRGSHWALTLGARSTTEVSSRSAKMPFGEAMLLPTWHENLCVTHKYDYAPS